MLPAHRLCVSPPTWDNFTTPTVAAANEPSANATRSPASSTEQTQYRSAESAERLWVGKLGKSCRSAWAVRGRAVFEAAGKALGEVTRGAQVAHSQLSAGLARAGRETLKGHWNNHKLAVDASRCGSHRVQRSTLRLRRKDAHGATLRSFPLPLPASLRFRSTKNGSRGGPHGAHRRGAPRPDGTGRSGTGQKGARQDGTGHGCAGQKGTAQKGAAHGAAGQGAEHSGTGKSRGAQSGSARDGESRARWLQAGERRAGAAAPVGDLAREPVGTRHRAKRLPPARAPARSPKLARGPDHTLPPIWSCAPRAS